MKIDLKKLAGTLLPILLPLIPVVKQAIKDAKKPKV